MCLRTFEVSSGEEDNEVVLGSDGSLSPVATWDVWDVGRGGVAIRLTWMRTASHINCIDSLLAGLHLPGGQSILSLTCSKFVQLVLTIDCYSQVTN